jgi:putative copper export protein
MLEAAAATLAIVATLRARKGHGDGWWLGALATVALALSFALSGHAVAVPQLAAVAVLADTLHIIGAGGWLGTLLVVVLVGIPLALRQPEGERGWAAAATVNAFSPVALACAALLAATGLVAAWIHLGALSDLWTSDYGRVLLLKLGVICAIAALGAVNWRVLRPALGNVAAARRIRSSAMTELAVGALVLAITAVLVATPPPGEETKQAPVASGQASVTAGVGLRRE